MGSRSVPRFTSEGRGCGPLQTASSGTGLCPGSSLLRDLGPRKEAVAAPSPCFCRLSPVSGAGERGGGQACGEGGGSDRQKTPTGRPRGQRAGAPAGGCDLPGLEDYSARHAPRASLRASGPRRVAGHHLGVWLWFAGPFLPSVGLCQQNHWVFGLGKPQNVQSIRSEP